MVVVGCDVVVGYGVIGLEVGSGGFSSVAPTSQLPPKETVSEDPNFPPLPINVPFTEIL